MIRPASRQTNHLARLSPSALLPILLIGLLLGFSFSLGEAFYDSLGLLSFADIRMWVRALAEGVIISLLALAAVKLARQCLASASTSRGALSTWLLAHSPQQLTPLLTALIVVAWIPALLAFWPGNYSSDGPIQVTYLLNGGILDLHWPAAHTLLLTGCLQLGNLLFGSYDAGLTVFCTLQALALAATLAYAASKALGWGVPPALVLALTALTALNPVVQSYAFATAKDTLFAVFFLLVLVRLADLLRCSVVPDSPASLAAITAELLGLCLMRKQGLIVVAMAYIVALPRFRGAPARVRLMAPLVLSLALSACFSAAVAAAFPTRPDSPRELLSVPSQQIVRTYVYERDSLTTDQVAAIDTFYDLSKIDAGLEAKVTMDDTPMGTFYNMETGSGYLAPIADPAKGALREEAFARDPLGYVALWARLAQGHESNYVRAFLWGVMGYLYPSPDVQNRWVGLTVWNEFGLTIASAGPSNQVSDYNKTTLLPRYLAWLHEGNWDLFKDMPVLGPWVCPASPFLALSASAVLFAARKRGDKGMVVAWLLPFVYLLTLFLGPVVCLRYAVPLFCSIPVIVSLPFVRTGGATTIKGTKAREAEAHETIGFRFPTSSKTKRHPDQN